MLGISNRAEEREGRAAPDRKHDGRTRSMLDAALEENERAGATAPVTRTGDGPSPLLTIEPGPEPAAIMAGGPIRHPWFLPETGRDLSDWVERVRARNGWTAAETAAFLGIDRDTLRDAARAELLPLPKAVRVALSTKLWGANW